MKICRMHKMNENEGFKYKDSGQLENSLDVEVRHWIWKLTTLTPQGVNVAENFIVKIVVAEGKGLDFSLPFD